MWRRIENLILLRIPHSFRHQNRHKLCSLEILVGLKGQITFTKIQKAHRYHSRFCRAEKDFEIVCQKLKVTTGSRIH